MAEEILDACSHQWQDSPMWHRVFEMILTNRMTWNEAAKATGLGVSSIKRMFAAFAAHTLMVGELEMDCAHT